MNAERLNEAQQPAGQSQWDRASVRKMERFVLLVLGGLCVSRVTAGKFMFVWNQSGCFFLMGSEACSGSQTRILSTNLNEPWRDCRGMCLRENLLFFRGGGNINRCCWETLRSLWCLWRGWLCFHAAGSISVLSTLGGKRWLGLFTCEAVAVCSDRD